MNFMPKIRTAILTLSFTFSLLVLVPAPAKALDCGGQDKGSTACLIQEGACDVSGECNTKQSEQKIEKTITRAVNVTSMIIGAVAVVMIMVAGFRYITSGGAQDRVKGAKDTLLYAIIGLIIVALAQLIVRFVINTTG
jgi:hypothetical protein